LGLRTSFVVGAEEGGALLVGEAGCHVG
jgi:hypothetical protein